MDEYDMSNDGDDGRTLSPVESIKANSNHLRGKIADVLAGPEDHFSEDEKQLLKFHGSYQQEDRDARKNRSKAGVGKHYMFMVRAKMPGGKLTAKQYLAVDDIAERCANGTVRITTRQGIQLHGIVKSHLKETIAGINECLLTTLGACGDVSRNVMACPAPLADEPRRVMQKLADEISEHLAPRSRAYYEIWLNGNNAGGSGEEYEPIYGKVYLPRKFKVGLGLADDNCIDIYAQDLGFLAIVEGGKLLGFDVLVGGGMGRTNGKPGTFAALGKHICFVPPDEAVSMAESVVKLYRDHGNRADRKRARIKYLVADWGVEKFREVLATYAGKPLVMPKEPPITGVDLHVGWHEQGDGKLFLGLSIENGRIKDDGAFRLRSGLRAIAERFNPTMRATAQQDLLICDIDPANKPAIEALMDEYGIPHPDRVAKVRQWSMACPAIPTCGLAITESERTMPGLIDQLDAKLTELGLSEETISVRMTGCPNGCARPYQSDIGLVGRSGDKYTLFLGGATLGTRLNFEAADLVKQGDIVTRLTPLLTEFKEKREAGESFGDFCHKLGTERVKAAVAEVK